MLFLEHLDDMHGVGLLWKVTLWGWYLNIQLILSNSTLNTLKKEKKKFACIFFVNRSLQMTIAGRYELENTLGSQNEALPSQIYNFINNLLEN